MKYLCTGDLHLTERSRLGPEWLDKQAEVWQRVLELGIEKGCERLLFCGDAFEDRFPTPREMEVFEHTLRRVWGDRGFDIIAGNHDVVNAQYPTAIEVLHGHRTGIRTPGIRGSVGMLPWTPIGRLAASSDAPRDRVVEEASDLLVKAALDMAGEAEILMLHWSVAGASLPNGLPVDQLRETVLDIDPLLDHYRAIVCGHIHKPQSIGDRPWAFYVGSPMPLNFGEANTDHGCWIYDDATPDAAVFFPIEGPRFFTHDAKAGSVPIKVEGAVVRVRCDDAVVGGTIKADLIERGAYRVFIEQEVGRDVKVRGPEVSEDVSPLEAAEIYATTQGWDEAHTDALVDDTRERLALPLP